MDTISDLLAWNDQDDVATSTTRSSRPSRNLHRRFLSGSSDFFLNPDSSFLNINSSNNGNSGNNTTSNNLKFKELASANSAAASAGNSSSPANIAQPSLDSSAKNNNSFFSNFLPSAKANLNNQIYDKLMEKVVLMALPAADSELAEASIQQRLKDSSSRPQFSVQILTKNFVDLNSRLSIPFTTINNAIKIFNWKYPFFNIFILILLSNVIVNPVSWLMSSPFLFLAFGIMVPQYIQKYPLDSTSYQNLYHIDTFPFPSYLPLQKPIESKPCNQFSKEFFLNLTDLQNFMFIYAFMWDFFNSLLSNFIYFKFESLSNFAFILLVLMAFLSFRVLPNLLTLLSPFIKLLFILMLWGLMFLMHPKYRKTLIEILSIDTYIANELQKISKYTAPDSDPISHDTILPQINEMDVAGKSEVKHSSGNSPKKLFDNLNDIVNSYGNNNENENHKKDSEVIQFPDDSTSADVSKIIRRSHITKAISKKVNKKKILTNVNILLQKETYIKLIDDEFDYDSYLNDLAISSTIADHCVLDSSNCKAYQLVEIFELQAFNKIENEWKESIFTPDHFTVNSTIRKLIRFKLKPRRKSDKFKALFVNSDNKPKSKNNANDDMNSINNNTLDVPSTSSQTSNVKPVQAASPSIYSFSNLLTSPNYESDSSFFGNQNNTGNAASGSGQILTGYDSLKPKIFSTSLNMIEPPKNYKFMYLLPAELSTVNPNTPDQNEIGNSTSIMKDTMNNFHLQSMYASNSWKLDLFPVEWCKNNYIKEVVDVDEDTKWVYDKVTDDVEVKFRRRRWIRMVERISEFEYNHDDDII